MTSARGWLVMIMLSPMRAIGAGYACQCLSIPTSRPLRPTAATRSLTAPIIRVRLAMVAKDRLPVPTERWLVPVYPTATYKSP